MIIVTYKKLLLLSVLPAIMLASCSREDLDGGDDGSRTPVAFTAVVQSAALPQLTDTGGSSPATRTALGPDGNTKWTQGDAVNVFMLTSGGTFLDDIIPGGDNVIHNVDPASGALTPAEGTPMYYPADTAVDFIAWHIPTGHAIDNNYHLYLDVSDQTTVEKQLALDPLYSDNARGVSRRKNPVALQFRHLMSKVRFDITLGLGLTNGNLTEVQLQEAISYQGFDIRYGDVRGDTYKRDAISPLRSAVPSGGADATYTALVFPKVAYSDLAIVITVNGKEYTGTIPVTDAYNYKANTMYTYPVTVRETGVEVGIPATDVPWTEGELPTVTLDNKTFRLIRNADDLKRFADDVNNGQRDLNALQTADIDLSGIDNWKPINQIYGISSDFFTGIYNGNGYTISNLKINSISEGNFIGLFGRIGSGALLTGIHLRNVEIIAKDQEARYIGTLVGRVNEGATVSLCSAQGGVDINIDSGENAGGLAGGNSGVITRCRTNVTVTADVTLLGTLSAGAGGITGANYGLLFACHAAGSVTLTGSHESATYKNYLCAGGITGENRGTLDVKANNIYCCIAEGNVSVTSKTEGISVCAGGLAGLHVNGIISNSYARGNATAKKNGTSDDEEAGAIIGYGSSDYKVSHCYGTGAIGKGTSNLEASSNDIVYNTNPNNGDILNIVSTGNLTDIPFTYYDPTATPAYGMTVTKSGVSINDFWLSGDGTWPILDFTKNN